MMIKIAVCDDEAIMRRETIAHLNEYARMRGLELAYDQFCDGHDLLRSPKIYQVILLDFELGAQNRLNGMDVAKKYRQRHEDAAIIFLTNHAKTVFSAFEVGAFRFLIKPLEPQKLYAALDDYLKTLMTDQILMVRVDGETNIVHTNQILYLEADGKYCTLRLLPDGAALACRETLAEVESLLPPAFFFRCHRSYVVNLKYVRAYDHQDVVLRNQGRVPISRNKYEPFNSAFIAYSKRYGY